jgi:metallo-beta-lactamase family protein
MTMAATVPGPTLAPVGDRLRFLGAAGTVTGSKHLVETSGHRLLLDCGLFQGLKPLRLRNWQALPGDPASLDAVVLSHAQAATEPIPRPHA